jgi:hypothetical protein
MTRIPPSFELFVDPQGKLVLRSSDQPDVVDVRVRRAFPWFSPQRHISIRNSEGKELLLIDDLAQVPESQRRVIEAALAHSVFIPRITRVEQVDVRFGYQMWTVQTDRGPAEFRVQEREDIRFLNDGRFSIKDADGNVYELMSLDKLDERSRKAIEALL